jgi:hypothetical protein
MTAGNFNFLLVFFITVLIIKSDAYVFLNKDPQTEALSAESNSIINTKKSQIMNSVKI